MKKTPLTAHVEMTLQDIMDETERVPEEKE